MKLASAAQMRRIDKVTIEERGVPGRELMDRAGKAVAREAMERFSPDSVAIIAGKGNNGGDGFVAARALERMGVGVGVFLLFDMDGAAGDVAGDARAAFEKMPPEVQVHRLKTTRELHDQLIRYDLVIDAIFGTGLRGAPKGFPAEAIEALNACEVNVLSVDVPSGLFEGMAPRGSASTSSSKSPSKTPVKAPVDLGVEDDSSVGPCVRAQVTVTIGLPKLMLAVEPGVRLSGLVTVADIGFPSDLLEDEAIRNNLLGADEMREALPPRDPAGHKGTFGRVAILAGSEGMTGAAVLAARAAVRSGAGLVYSIYPKSLTTIMESHLIEPVKRPLAGGQGWFTKVHLEAALAEAAQADAVALGPGVGQRKATKTFVEGIVRSVEAPLVIDADGLNLIADAPDVLEKRRSSSAPTVLTPHPGEAARLLGVTNAEIQANRIEACDEIAARYGAVVALKGAQTVVTAPDGQRYINPTGNSGLAKGGSGDVLTGLIAGLLAQGCDALVAAQLGVFLHGLAADEAARKFGVRAMTPSDVVHHLGDAYLYLEKKK